MPESFKTRHIIIYIGWVLSRTTTCTAYPWELAFLDISALFFANLVHRSNLPHMINLKDWHVGTLQSLQIFSIYFCVKNNRKMPHWSFMEESYIVWPIFGYKGMSIFLGRDFLLLNSHLWHFHWLRYCLWMRYESYFEPRHSACRYSRDCFRIILYDTKHKHVAISYIAVYNCKFLNIKLSWADVFHFQITVPVQPQIMIKEL